jgi:hypothetical protein
MEAGSVLLGRNAGEAEAMSYYYHLGIDGCKQLLARDENLQAKYHFPHANPAFTPRHLPYSQSNSLNTIDEVLGPGKLD